MKRRTFCGAGIAAAAGGSAACSKQGGGSAWRFFSDRDARTIDAMCGQLIPADQDAGAREARVVGYIDLQLAKRFRRFQPMYQRGLEVTAATSNRLFQRPFVELSAQQQVAVLEDLEKNEKPFFELLLAHTRQGFYGDPRHGGNYRMASWKMLGLPFPQVRGRQHYEEPKARS